MQPPHQISRGIHLLWHFITLRLFRFQQSASIPEKEFEEHVIKVKARVADLKMADISVGRQAL